MSERLNKTSIYSIIFLDIIDYSKKAVSLQIEQKEAFNTITTIALDGIAQTDRIILDTGDGLAIALLGEPEEALFVSLTIRDHVVQYNIDHEPNLFVRIGINLGPVRVVKDINGRPNIIGDGINVAERVMSFAKPNQILVSRTYYEVTSRLTDEINVMFSYFGMKQDKHVREHEIYEINAEAKTTKSFSELNGIKQNRFGQSKTLLNTFHPSNLWANKSQILEKNAWLFNKYFVMGLAVLLVVIMMLSLPKSTPEIIINTNESESTVDSQLTLPSRPIDVDLTLDSSLPHINEPTVLNNTEEPPPSEKLKYPGVNANSVIKKTTTKKLDTTLPEVPMVKNQALQVKPEAKKEAGVESPRLHEPAKIVAEPMQKLPEQPSSKCTQAEKALNQCRY